MTRDEAIKALDEGKTLTHFSFTDKEWVRKSGNLYEFEDECLCEPDEFWKWRTHTSFDKGWKVF
jgi:hypothetical protein